MSSGTVRIALECHRSELASCPLHSVPIWTMHCNGRKLGFATKRKASHHNRLMLKTMQSTTVGAGMIPAGFGSSDSEEIMYMRANYEHVIGNSDYESFHLVNPDECSGQELSVFLMRPRRMGFSLTLGKFLKSVLFFLGVPFNLSRGFKVENCKELLFLYKDPIVVYVKEKKGTIQVYFSFVLLLFSATGAVLPVRKRRKLCVSWLLEWKARREAGFTEQRKLPTPGSGRITGR
ncbi:hypothetical protein V6N13_072691 [Hibiscus sabdariffa]